MSEEMPSGDELFGAKEIKISKDFGIEGQALEDLKKPTEVQVVEHYPAMKADQGMQLLKEQMQIFIKSKLLPVLSDTHISLLKHEDGNPALQSFEEFVLSKLR